MKLLSVYFLALIGVVLVQLILLTKYFPNISNAFLTCWMEPHKVPLILEQLRGKNYWLHAQRKSSKYCLVTSWAICHIILYAIIGYMFPNLFWETFAIGVVYEILEWKLFDCHDVLDVLWNSIGFFIGVMIRCKLR